jgi:hypothetical protein
MDLTTKPPLLRDADGTDTDDQWVQFVRFANEASDKFSACIMYRFTGPPRTYTDVMRSAYDRQVWERPQALFQAWLRTAQELVKRATVP